MDKSAKTPEEVRKEFNSMLNQIKQTTDNLIETARADIYRSLEESKGSKDEGVQQSRAKVQETFQKVKEDIKSVVDEGTKNAMVQLESLRKTVTKK